MRLDLPQFNVEQGATVVAIEAIGPVVSGQQATFLLKGTKLPAGLVVNIQDCGVAAEVAQGGTDSQRQFTCTFPPTAQAGIKDVGIGAVGSLGTAFARSWISSVLTVNLVRSTVSGITAAPSPTPGNSTLVTVSGANLPATAFALVVDATCDRSSVSARPDGSGFTQTCTFGPTAGTKGVTVMSSADTSGFIIDDSKSLTVSAPLTDLQFIERPDTGSGWNLRVTVTARNANGNDGSFNFGNGQCTGTLTYEGKDVGGNYLFQENHLTGGCWRTCKIAIASDASHYNERCTGGPYNGGDIAPANRLWLSPRPTSSQLDSLLPPSVLVRDLVGHWTLDDCALGTGRAADSSVLRREALYGAICVPGMKASALEFMNPGTNTYGGTHSMHLGAHTSAAITFSAWVKWLGTLQSNNSFGTAGALWSIGVHGIDPFMSIWINEGGVAADGGKLWTDRLPNSTYQLRRDEWTMVSITSDGTSETVYVNGEPIGTASYPRAMSYQGVASYVSKHYWGSPGSGQTDWAARFRGVVDDVRMYGRSLSGAEIRELYYATR